MDVMPTARALLDRLTADFAADAKMENVVRQLQKAKRIPVGGRGASAHQLSVREAALILLSYLGTLKAVGAEKRLKKLEKLRSQSSPSEQLIDALTAILTGTRDAERILVSRNKPYARIDCVDGAKVEFHPEDFNPRGGFRIDAVLHQGLIREIRLFLNDGSHE